MAQVTIEDVAKAAGVSTFTVSRALRGMDHVAPRTREKVLQAAKELNYTVSKAASALASGQTNRVALLSRDRIAGWFMGELLDGLYDVFNPARYDLLIYRAGNAEERSGFFTNLPANRNADALIGRRAVVREAIPAGGAGYVAIDGDMWRSVSADGSGIPEGTAVEVVSRESIILTVKPLN